MHICYLYFKFVCFFVSFSAPSLILFGGRWTPQTSHQIMRSANQELCSICTMCSTRTWDRTSVRPSTRRERTGTRPGCMWNVRDFIAVYFYQQSSTSVVHLFEYRARFVSAAAPEWAETINNTQIDIGSEHTMRCVASGKPFPFIRWYKDGYMVKSHSCCHLLLKTLGSTRHQLAVH